MIQYLDNAWKMENNTVIEQAVSQCVYCTIVYCNNNPILYNKNVQRCPVQSGNLKRNGTVLF